MVANGFARLSRHAQLYDDFILANENVQFAHDIAHNARKIHFDCHHNSFLAIRFLKQRGHDDLQWVHGYYQCARPEDGIKHSWIALHLDSQPAIILELDARQLHTKGGYENDEMPDSTIALIAHPDRVSSPDGLGCTLVSAAVFARYSPNPHYGPDVDYSQLDELVNEVIMYNSENTDAEEVS